MVSSLLHTACAKAQQSNTTSSISLEGLRLLLVEEESSFAHDDTGLLSNSPQLAFSLAMDAALSVVASSNLDCRGCTKQNKSVDNSERGTGAQMSCRCCKIALLIPGETKQSRKRRTQSNNNDKYSSSRVVGVAGKLEFPMHCKQESNLSQTLPFVDNNADSQQWDQNVLNQIHIKYVNSLSDLIRYLAYAPSLPEHLQPLDGVFVMGLGELLSREINTAGSTEMTHAREFICHLLLYLILSFLTTGNFLQYLSYLIQGMLLRPTVKK
jgi:hypothetical protein